MAFYRILKNHYSIEIDFEGNIPDYETRTELKETGYKWNPHQKVWWANYNMTSKQLAIDICGDNDDDPLEHIIYSEYPVDCPYCETLYDGDIDIYCPNCGYSYLDLLQGMESGKYGSVKEMVKSWEQDERHARYEYRRKNKELKEKYSENWQSFGMSGGSFSPR